jgi:acetyl esterase/lipase
MMLPLLLLLVAEDFTPPGDVEYRPGIVYASYGDRELKLDLYLPKRGKAPFPAIVYIHGGGWRGGTPAQFRPQAVYMAQHGYAGVCIEHRFSQEARFPAALYDAKAAVRWVRANARQYRIHPQKIAAAGGSSGGHLAALLGVTHHLGGLEGDGGNPKQSSRVMAVAAFNPPLDLVALGKFQGSRQDQMLQPFLGDTYSKIPAIYRAASPVTYVHKDAAPMLFLHGTGDMVVPYQQSVDMMNALKTLGVRAETFTAEGAGHGFFNRPPWYELTLQRMEAFFAGVFQ